MRDARRWRQHGGAVMLGLLLSACSNAALTLDNYDRLEAGMTRAEVEAILGAPAGCSGAILFDYCRWGDERRFIQAQFVNGEAVAFQYQGLR